MALALAAALGRRRPRVQPLGSTASVGCGWRRWSSESRWVSRRLEWLGDEAVRIRVAFSKAP